MVINKIFEKLVLTFIPPFYFKLDRRSDKESDFDSCIVYTINIISEWRELIEFVQIIKSLSPWGPCTCSSFVLNFS